MIDFYVPKMYVFLPHVLCLFVINFVDVYYVHRSGDVLLLHLFTFNCFNSRGIVIVELIFIK